jgi:hypothetical protein
MKKFLAVPILLAMSCLGCGSAYQTAQQFQSVLTGILNLGLADVSAIPAADQPAVTQWIQAAQTLNTQLGVCVAAAGTNGKAAAFGSCFDTFAAGLTSPAELAQLRVLSAASQQKVELIATAAILAVNGALAIYNLATQPQPQIAQAPSHQDLVAFAHQVGVPAEGF